MSPQREKIQFDPNVTVAVTLEFDGGKEVAGRSGPQYLYWVDGQRSMFVDPPLHAEIQASGAKAGDTLEITPRKQGRSGVAWEVVQVVDEPPAPRPAPPPPPLRSQPRQTASQPAAPITQPSPISQPITPATVALTGAFCVAIDALREAQDYARRKGIEMPITADAIRSTAISVYIDRCKGGSR